MTSKLIAIIGSVPASATTAVTQAIMGPRGSPGEEVILEPKLCDCSKGSCHGTNRKEGSICSFQQGQYSDTIRMGEGSTPGTTVVPLLVDMPGQLP